MNLHGNLAAARGLLGLLALGLLPASAQQDYGARLGLSQGDEYSYAPQGPGVMLNAVDPAMRKWYVPQELYLDYRWRQWDYTNYARDHYQRYIDTTLEGEHFYDIYGNFLTRGWLIYNNSQTTPEQFGNSLLKSNRFRDWFSGVVVTHDQKGQYHFSLTVSNQLRTVLTPMVFSKPRFDGLQFDLATDRTEATLLYSRISSPGGSSTLDREFLSTNNTSLLGGRVAAQIGDYLKLGVHGVNAHQSNTLRDKTSWNPFAGELTVSQNEPISFVQLVLRDDSPADGEGGAAWFPAGSDIFITYQDGTRERGREIGFTPVVEGGIVRQGFLAADGTEEIRLIYDFDSPGFLDRAKYTKSEIVEVEFQLQMGNDYQVWMTSDTQTDFHGQPVLLLVAQAEGNVRDITNLRTLRFHYGLPTATHVAGGSLEIRAPFGLDVYGEYDRSWNYRKYPNPAEEIHHSSSGIKGAESAPAWMVNVSRRKPPLVLLRRGLQHGPLLQHPHPALHPGRGHLLRRHPQERVRAGGGQRRPRPHPRHGAHRLAQGRSGGLPRLGPEQRLRPRLQPERQPGPDQCRARLRGGLPALRRRPAGVSLRRRHEPQLLGRPVRERRGPRLPVPQGPRGLQPLRRRRSRAGREGDGGGCCARS